MKKYIPLTIGLLAVVFLLAFSFGLGKAQEGSLAEDSSNPEAVDDSVGPYIPVQGRLTDAGGNPLNGDYSVTFRLYNVATGGIELCHDTNTVNFDQGLFNTEIYGNCAGVITGEQLYIGIEVGSDGEMNPRQPIYAAPYAWSLRPGAVISASLGSTPNLHIETWSSNGRGLRSYAMSSTGANYGVVGASLSPDGFGGYFYNNGGGTGLYAYTDSFAGFGVVGLQSDNYSMDDYTDFYMSGGLFGGVNGVIGISHETVRVGAGVYGWAQATTGTSYGVRGRADSTNGQGVYGHAFASTGTTEGVYGRSDSTEGRGVSGYASATSGTTYGVYGQANSTDGRGVYGLADNSGGIGVYGKSEVGSGIYGESSSGWGTYGLSTSNWAVVGDTQRTDRNYGVYTPDNLYSLNFHLKGAIMQVVQNGGSEPLEAGDVAVFSGMIAPTDVNEPPIILVSKATTANSTAVAGVVYGRYSLEGKSLEGAAQPGEFLLLVVQGPARVKVTAAAGAIQPGDLLSSNAQAGLAAKAAMVSMQGVQTTLPGTVFAKALEALESGEGWIYVFVTLQ